MQHSPAAAAGELERFFHATAAGFDLAAKHRGETSHQFRIAGREARVRIAGPALEHLARPLAHLNAARMQGRAADRSSIEILAWDSPDGWLPPRPPWDFSKLAHGGAIAGLDSDRVLVNFCGDHGLLMMLHRPSGRAIYWLPSAEQLPFWEIAAPFRILLHWWSQSFGGQVVHAAAIGRNGDGVLLTGRGGSGKSTTAVACVDAGMEYVGDDYVLLLRDPAPAAHSLYHSAKIHTAFLGRALPHWTSRVARQIGPERKSLIFVDECAGHQVRDRLAIRAIVQPKVTTARHAKLVSQPMSRALLAIAPSTMFQLPQARQTTLSLIADSVRELKSFRLDLGSEIASGPEQLTMLLQGKMTNEVRHAA